MKKLTGFSFILTIAICVLGFYFFYAKGITYKIQKDISMEVSSGEGFNRIISRINKFDSGVSVRAAKLHLKLRGLEKSLKIGEYKFLEGLTVEEIIHDLSIGKVVKYKVVIPEGYNVFEIADLFVASGIVKSKKDFLDITLSAKAAKEFLGFKAKTLEGYLYPATYAFSKNTEPYLVVKQLTEAHKNNFNKLMSLVSMPEGFDQHKLVTMASIVEKETGAAVERPLIASVFLNRLKKRMRIQSDPTTIYGEWVKTGERLFNIRKKHLLAKNEYNTYAIKALPVGPISNPGFEALKAVCEPAQSDYLYFVSKNDGTHYFSKTYAEHNSAVRKYQMSKKARAGKSWRDLKKKK